MAQDYQSPIFDLKTLKRTFYRDHWGRSCQSNHLHHLPLIIFRNLLEDFSVTHFCTRPNGVHPWKVHGESKTGYLSGVQDLLTAHLAHPIQSTFYKHNTAFDKHSLLTFIMLPALQKASLLLKLLKRSLSGKSKKASSNLSEKSQVFPDGNQSPQSFPEKSIPIGTIDVLSTTSSSSYHSLQSRTSSESSPESLEPDYPVDESSVSSSFTKPGRSVELTKSIQATKVLFSPLKSPNFSRSKLPFHFPIKKTKSVGEFQTAGTAPTLPMITLTPPEDEHVYVLYRAIPPIISNNLLSVPTRPAYRFSTRFYDKSKKYPHPAGPWLRPINYQDYCFKTGCEEKNWRNGSRLGNGKVVGWNTSFTQVLGVPLPPQLPNEHDLERLALVEQISLNLDEAQKALYGNLHESWDVESEEEEYSLQTSLENWSTSLMASHVGLYDPDAIEVVE
ncbi:hypothetical protein O181_037713 [Austropuccinia psidii MF-1]|uniref:Uncharacterized protein n=1 Tax=Austropuccinia psidii MF-1 TaxID=1389203 RepID=A0A9Q3DBY6_9BASI|nr:hypothetical protein [Austropuccinia psidii MF-1]